MIPAANRGGEARPTRFLPFFDAVTGSVTGPYQAEFIHKIIRQREQANDRNETRTRKSGRKEQIAMHPRMTSPRRKRSPGFTSPGRPSGERRGGLTPAATRRKPTPRTAEWDACAAIREATAGALQALAVIVSFVLFGMSWAVLADASQSNPERVPPCASVDWLATAPAGAGSAYDVQDAALFDERRSPRPSNGCPR